MSRKLFILSTLYFVQGLPYGFQLTALPVYLRQEGMSLTAIGFASVLSLPWAFKVIWGPLVDRFSGGRLGARRSWILPLQLGLLASCLAAAFIPPARGLGLLLAMVFLMNLFAATMDVAVDGLAVDLLTPSELGYGNIAQVVGYKLGALTGGGLLVWASGFFSWRGQFFTMAALLLGALLVTWSFREPERPDRALAISTLKSVFAMLWRALQAPGTSWLLVFIATYKMGETMADAMFKPFLVDAGFSQQQIGLWVGTWGMLFSLAGSFLGGLLASRFGVLPALAVTAVLRALAVGSEWWLSLVTPTTERVVGVVAAEQLFGGAITTATFAFMMSRINRKIGATHYTLLATVEVVGKLGISAVSGLITERTSYPTLFALATLLAVAFLGLLIPLLRPQPNATTP